MILCYLGTAVLNLVWPYLSGTVLYDQVLAKNEAFLAMLHIPAGRFLTALVVITLAMILTKVTIQALGILQGVLTARIAPEVVGKIKSQVFASMGKLSISFYTRRQTGSLMTRVSDDAEEISSFFIDGIPYFFINVGTLLATTVIMFLLNPLLALVSVCLMPALVVISFRMMPRLWHYYGKRHRAKRRLNGQMNENFTGARVVRAFGQEEQEITRFSKNNGRVQDAELDVARYDNAFFALYCTVEDIISFLVWAVGGALMIGGSHMELGMLLTFSGYVGQMKGPLEFQTAIAGENLLDGQRIAMLRQLAGEMAAAPDTIYTMLADADMKFPVIKDETRDSGISVFPGLVEYGTAVAQFQKSLQILHMTADVYQFIT